MSSKFHPSRSTHSERESYPLLATSGPSSVHSPFNAGCGQSIAWDLGWHTCWNLWPKRNSGCDGGAFEIWDVHASEKGFNSPLSHDKWWSFFLWYVYLANFSFLIEWDFTSEPQKVSQGPKVYLTKIWNNKLFIIFVDFVLGSVRSTLRKINKW